MIMQGFEQAKENQQEVAKNQSNGFVSVPDVPEKQMSLKIYSKLRVFYFWSCIVAKS